MSVEDDPIAAERHDTSVRRLWTCRSRTEDNSVIVYAEGFNKPWTEDRYRGDLHDL